MLRLTETFNQLKLKGRKALIPFIMGGDPNIATTSALLMTLQDAGADAIEVGIPFSDPLADGPVIQQSSARALAQGINPQKVLDMIALARSRLQVPIVCLSYWNPVLQFGHKFGFAKLIQAENALTPLPFIRSAKVSGVSGLIIPDLPIEEAQAFQKIATQETLASIFLAAPTSTPQRLRSIARLSRGFIYYVSVTGTTGVRGRLPKDLFEGLRQLRSLSSKPICVGFGISTAKQARQIVEIADGVIVGSALIQAMRQGRSKHAICQHAARFLGRLRRALG